MMKDALISKEDVHVITIDWSKGAFVTYEQAILMFIYTAYERDHVYIF